MTSNWFTSVTFAHTTCTCNWPLAFLLTHNEFFVIKANDSAAEWILNVNFHCQSLSSKSSREDMCRLSTSFLLNIQSRVKQEVDMPHIQNCVTRYSSPYWCSVPNIRKLASVVPEKNVTEILCDADVRRRIVIPICRLR